jgi:membrane-associated phospholipid phosphatase
LIERLTPPISRTADLLRKSGIWDLALMAVALLLYYLVRGMVAERASEATSRAIRLVELERKLGLFWEPQMQAWIMGSETLVKLFNGIYVYAHFPLVAAIGLWLFFLHRPKYVLFRNAFLISGAIGLVIFNLLPTAPPRLLPWPYGLVDTMAAYSSVNYDMQPAAFVNHYAALPSLHFGWNLLLGLALVWAVRNPLTWAIAVVMPTAMGLSVIVTANHFILDVVAGAVVALFGLAAALDLARFLFA